MGEEPKPETPTPAPKKKPSQWQHADWVSSLGKWAWLLIILNAVIYLIFTIYGLVVTIQYWEALKIVWEGLGWGVPPFPGLGLYIWAFIGIAVEFIVGFFIIKPKFSDKCAEKDWDALYNWTLDLGNVRLPWMLIWGILIEIFSWYYWGGLPVLVPAVMLLFAGPKEFKWSKK